jgi:hypothetical protein
MPVIQKGVAALANRLPKVISPKAHAIIDYVTIGSFGLLAYLFWRKTNAPPSPPPPAALPN